ncbi:hypothetical protein FGO68_gene10199 [Halteria grandinella]|uniref:Uncharacterized protein n=1 Tax=Halteria grandinella TaxID=5974 RepID=A0A8J8P363_HALGN|nr:hypothetical protein FGO68_gene10199 [Halteria grandinella]
MALNLLFSLLNDLSFMISLSMVSIPIPGIARPIQSVIMQIIYLDMLMTDKWLTPLLQRVFYQEEMDDDSAVNESMDEQGFGSKLLLFNLGSTLIFFAIEVFLLLSTSVLFFTQSTSSMQDLFSLNLQQLQILLQFSEHSSLVGRLNQVSHLVVSASTHVKPHQYWQCICSLFE